ncbi:hypothetical protein Scep_006831 [Stephania cephalantha]|uniref:Uncharacterized protein n=1 Tax=Stephania cephalantha TaxID=152367 RepID=A0AAP0PML7_9MAGN
MATGWVKSLHCKSRAIEDVFLPNPKQPPNQFGALSSSCRKSVQSLKDVVDTTTKKTHKKPRNSNPQKPIRSPSSDLPHRSSTRSSTSSLTRSPPVFPALTELPDGHPSRKVVEIIFHSSWYPKEEFSGRIEMLFKIQNAQKTVARFEEYREIVKSRALTCSAARENEDDVARCVADGNEVMRFHCLGATAGAICEVLWRFSGKEAAVCTFSGSGAAHERGGGGGGGKGRRAMLVCRVIAGRVCKRFRVESFVDGRVGFDSVGGENGELLVLDSRAVLPCFLIIYKF